MALNLIKNGFDVVGIDLKPERMAAFADMGGRAGTLSEIGRASAAVFVMVMKGDDAKDVIFDPDGLMANMAEGSAVILSATVKPSEARAIGAAMEGSGVHLIDTPVSGGFPGAQAGTLTMMAAASGDVLDAFAPVMEAVSANIHRVGDKPGDGRR